CENRPMRSDAPRNTAPRAGGDTWIVVGVVAALVFFLITGAVSYYNIKVLRDDNQKIIHSHDVILALDELLSTVQDTETGQRGFLLTGADRYLEPYNAAVSDVAARTDAVAALTRDNPDQQANLVQLKSHIDAKLAELKETIDLRRAQGAEAALAVVQSDRGKAEMDAIRAQLAVMKQQEVQLRLARLAEMQTAYGTAWLGGMLATALGIALTLIIGFLTRRAASSREHQNWLRSGQIGLSEAMLGDKPIERLSEDVLAYLATFVSSQAGALFTGERDHFRLGAKLGVPADVQLPEQISHREGLVGQAAAEGRAVVVHDLPESYLTIGSALGRDRPRHLAIAPFKVDGLVNGVVELGFLHEIEPRVLEFLEAVSASVGVALRSARYRSELQQLLEETQRQAEELQVQSEELRVSNEELEEQGNALKESQTRLEQQQVELEQTNSQLEEQAQQLETQRDDLVRTAAAVELKARELEQSSQYKSDFLANMSHELRTPLNSLLILSKLLGDNGAGNLSDEQVKYARTIQSSGNDLLTLINDILDLSKIEAGHVQIRPEALSLQRLAADLRQTFQPVAQEKQLSLDITIAKDAPLSITTDRQRLEQILRNLLSNAFKFTEKGGVRLTIEPAEGGLALAVADSGIGVSEEQHQAIFEAFRQADGTISRRFGGTGLGLSISRELSRLLGGTIALSSTPGEGATFTVTIPLAFDAERVAPRFERTGAAAASPVRPAPAPRVRPALTQPVADDRDELDSSRRLLLVIEDDANFAAIVRDLAHELGFQCVIANTAEQAIEAARTFRPNAVVLDVGLPDQSGLTVLDRLKRSDETRHIPIHVVSAADHSQTAMSLGAVGYLVKPVKREDLSSALQALDAKLSQGVRRVLIVEDDPVQRDAVSKLLSSSDVE
ncbi:MAG: multi-sensor hybrid histidine kinase, partial [Caulobacteraceae bacterium]|nr:multi-sensor hybrid histidine kinase [Caulobacteraceae bacterium]